MREWISMHVKKGILTVIRDALRKTSYTGRKPKPCVMNRIPCLNFRMSGTEVDVNVNKVSGIKTALLLKSFVDAQY